MARPNRLSTAVAPTLVSLNKRRKKMELERDLEFKCWLEAQPYVKATDRGYALFPCETSTKDIDREEQTAVVTISTKVKDRQRDIMEPIGALIENFRKNPVVLWAHHYGLPPFAKALWIKVEDDRIVSKAKFAQTVVGQELFYLYSEGFLNAWSIGFIPLAWERIEEPEPAEEGDGLGPRFPGYRITKWELLEYSGVPVPANPEALTHAFEEKRITAPVLVKALGEFKSEPKKVIPYKETPKAPEDEAWDAGREVREAEVGDLKVMCLWYNEEEPDVKGSYKGPHHKAKSPHQVVWRAVANAMAVLLGARGGFDVPEKDRKPMYNHLSKHYKAFDKEPPEFRIYGPQEIAGWVLEEGSTWASDTNDPEASPEDSTEKDTKPEPEETENTIRIRVRDPKDFVEDSFKTITISKKKGIKAVIGKLKEDPDGPTHIQSYIFDKSCENEENKCDWTVEEAQEWVDEHHEDTDAVLAQSEEAKDGSLQVLFTGNTVEEVVLAHICGILTMEEAVEAFTHIYEIMLGQKEGRVLSEKNRKLLRSAISEMKQTVKVIDKALKPLEELLEATEPPEKGEPEPDDSLEEGDKDLDKGSGKPADLEDEEEIVLRIREGEESRDKDNKTGGPVISAEFAEKIVGVLDKALRREIRQLQGRIDN